MLLVVPGRLGYCFNILTVVVMLVIINLRKYIHVAIGIIKEAAFALRVMPLMLFYPIWPIALLFMLCMYFMFVAANIASIEQFGELAQAGGGMNSTNSTLAYGHEVPVGKSAGDLTIVGSLSLVNSSFARNYTVAHETKMKTIFAYVRAARVACFGSTCNSPCSSADVAALLLVLSGTTCSDFCGRSR